MRATEVLDAVEHAWHDWNVSLDAMRWLPVPPIPRDEERWTIQVRTGDGTWQPAP